MIRLTRTQIHAFGELGLWMLRRRRRVRVEGRSMEPTLSAGDRVLVKPQARVKAGDIVVAGHPTDASLLVVKRIGRIIGKSQVELVSDNPDEGTDSRTWGPVDIDLVRGVVTLHVERAFETDSPNNLATRLRR